MTEVKRFEIRSSGTVIGWSDLEAADEGAGVLVGRFFPSDMYPLVQPIFLMWSDATTRTPEDEPLLMRYAESVERLQLTAHRTEGAVLKTRLVHVSDYSKSLGPEGLEVTVALEDPQLYAELFRERQGRDDA